MEARRTSRPIAARGPGPRQQGPRESRSPSSTQPPGPSAHPHGFPQSPVWTRAATTHSAP